MAYGESNGHVTDYVIMWPRYLKKLEMLYINNR